MDEHENPDTPKPVAWNEDDRVASPIDQADGRIEELLRQWKFWRNMTIALLIAYLTAFCAVVGGFSSMGELIDDAVIVVPNLAIWLAYARMQGAARRIDVWMEDE